MYYFHKTLLRWPGTYKYFMKAFRPLIIKGKCSHQMKTNQMIDTGLKGLAESFEVQENLLWALFMEKVHLPQGFSATARRQLSY